MTDRPLTGPQYEALKKYAEGRDGFFGSYQPHKKLLERGLIERCDTTRVFSEEPRVAMTTYRARITPAGKALLRTMQRKPSP